MDSWMLLAATVAGWAFALIVLMRRPDGNDAGDLRQTAHDLRADFATQRSELHSTLTTMRRENEEKLDAMALRVQHVADSTAVHQKELHAVLRSELDTMRRGNEEKLDKMREVVDEKLQGTLEKRLGESFKLVSERLELVQRGLGEMQSLASDVGGLKRVLTNVKSRGTWGEVQLARQLDDVLTPEQYDSNVTIKTGTRESVEFAIRLPGTQEGQAVYLPIDSKFPHEDYERLLDAYDGGEAEDVAIATKALERAILTQARTVSEKYISPPTSTDFAIMYLPTEGLFAEAMRIPGLITTLQNQYRVVVTGPTLLATLLNSLQMGFRTLAIEKRSSEVWQVLSAAKAEFAKYGQVWEKLGRQLQTAQNTVEEAGRRTRAVERRLRAVETAETDGNVGDLFAEIGPSGATEADLDNPVTEDR